MSITEELLDDDADGHHRDSRQGLYEALIGEPIGKCQPRPAICVNPETSVADAIDLMKAHGMGCVLIVRGGELTGIFTERDVLFRVAAARRDATTTRVGEVMTADPETLTSPSSTPVATRSGCSP
jgi:signal-transduction protein with cAMP-binding, CBS, and nucleotidyltransferase domain